MASYDLKKRIVEDRIIQKILLEEAVGNNGWIQLFENEFIRWSISFEELGEILLQLETESEGKIILADTHDFAVMKGESTPSYRLVYKADYEDFLIDRRGLGKDWLVADRLFFNPDLSLLRLNGKIMHLKKDTDGYRFVSLLFSKPRKIFSYSEIASALDLDYGENAKLGIQQICGNILRNIRKDLGISESGKYFVANNGYSVIST